VLVVSFDLQNVNLIRLGIQSPGDLDFLAFIAVHKVGPLTNRRQIGDKLYPSIFSSIPAVTSFFSM
jgi:hypothetical protein